MVLKSFIAASLVSLSTISSSAPAHTPTSVLSQPELSIETARRLLSPLVQENRDTLKMFDETVALWRAYYAETGFDLDRLLKAVVFAAQKHKGQIRKDVNHTPYIIHPIGVAKSLFEEGGIRNINVLVAALLHDTLEDTDATPEEIESLFGKRVRLTVEELSNDPNLSSAENKQRQVDHAPEMSFDAKLVKLADRLYNVRDLRSPPPIWTREYVLNYVSWGEKLLSALAGTNASLEHLLKQEIADNRAKGA